MCAHVGSPCAAWWQQTGLMNDQHFQLNVPGNSWGSKQINCPLNINEKPGDSTWDTLHVQRLPAHTESFGVDHTTEPKTRQRFRQNRGQIFPRAFRGFVFHVALGFKTKTSELTCMLQLWANSISGWRGLQFPESVRTIGPDPQLLTWARLPHSFTMH